MKSSCRLAHSCAGATIILECMSLGKESAVECWRIRQKLAPATIKRVLVYNAGTYKFYVILLASGVHDNSRERAYERWAPSAAQSCTQVCDELRAWRREQTVWSAVCALSWGGQIERCLLFVDLAAQRLLFAVCALSTTVFVTASVRAVFDLHATNKQRSSLARSYYEFLEIYAVSQRVYYTQVYTIRYTVGTLHCASLKVRVCCCSQM